MIWAWVKALTINNLEDNRKALLKALHYKEQVYLYDYCQLKELQFYQAYTQALWNLGAHTTQQNEGYHVVVKERLHKHLPLLKAVQVIANQTTDLGCKYNAKINRDRKTLPRLLDQRAFATVSDKITSYALSLAMKEWSATKLIADELEESQTELNFIPSTECKLGCELPLRYGLPCKHWLYKAFVKDIAIPISLFHPRWLLDGLAVLYER